MHQVVDRALVLASSTLAMFVIICHFGHVIGNLFVWLFNKVDTTYLLCFCHVIWFTGSALQLEPLHQSCQLSYHEQSPRLGPTLCSHVRATVRSLLSAWTTRRRPGALADALGGGARGLDLPAGPVAERAEVVDAEGSSRTGSRWAATASVSRTSTAANALTSSSLQAAGAWRSLGADDGAARGMIAVCEESNGKIICSNWGK